MYKSDVYVDFRFIPLFSVQAEMLFSQPDLRPVEALVVVHELKEAATAVAVSDISQLPRDINTASDIIARTVDLLLQSMDNSSAMQLAEVSINEVRVILLSSSIIKFLCSPTLNIMELLVGVIILSLCICYYTDKHSISAAIKLILLCGMKTTEC